MNERLARPLTPEESDVILEEMARAPADTPERRRMWQIADEMQPYVDKVLRRTKRSTKP